MSSFISRSVKIPQVLLVTIIYKRIFVVMAKKTKKEKKKDKKQKQYIFIYE